MYQVSYFTNESDLSTLSDADKIRRIGAHKAELAQIQDSLEDIVWENVNMNMVSIFTARDVRMHESATIEQCTADYTAMMDFINSVANIKYCGDKTFSNRAFALALNGLNNGWDLLETSALAARVAFMTFKMQCWKEDR